MWSFAAGTLCIFLIYYTLKSCNRKYFLTKFGNNIGIFEGITTKQINAQASEQLKEQRASVISVLQ